MLTLIAGWILGLTLMLTLIAGWILGLPLTLPLIAGWILGLTLITGSTGPKITLRIIKGL